jgi:hypothetical protein
MYLFNSTEWCYINRTTDNVLQILLQVVRGPGGGSSWNLSLCRPKNVLQRLQNIKCFERKIPLTFSLSSDFTKTMHNGFSPQFLYWIYQFLFIKIINFINDDCKLNLYVSLIMILICLDPCQWSLMSLITGNKVKRFLVIFYPLSPRTPF